MERSLLIFMCKILTKITVKESSKTILALKLNLKNRNKFFFEYAHKAI